MTKKKACKTCKRFVEKDSCPVCGSSIFTTSWQGRLYISNAQESMIAEKTNITANGEYAIKVR